jgi:hypothetical protein
MKGIPLSSLVANTYFDQPVFLDKSYLLLTPDSPVTPELMDRLKKWKYLQVFTDGKTKDLPSYMGGASHSSVGAQTIDEDIREGEQVNAARKFHTDFTTFTSGLFVKYSAEGLLNLGEVTEWIKKAIQMVHDSRDFLLRFLDNGAEGEIGRASCRERVFVHV